MIRVLTAGESHGQGLTAIIEGLPSGIPVNLDYINQQLKRRQGGYGRGERMKIEQAQETFFTRVRDGYTTGAPITMIVENKDWANWSDIMSPSLGASIEERVITLARPGHADLAGGIKYRQKDLRNILERASARETAVRVAIGALAQDVLRQLGILIWSHVVQIGNIAAKVHYQKLNDDLYETPLYCTDNSATEKMIMAIDEAKKQGDTLGGIIEVIVQHLPIGLGSHVHYDRKLDGKIASAVMSVQAIKGVEIGLGFDAAKRRGSMVHDEIFYDEQEKLFYHQTNHCGGLEGGMSNGEDIVIRCAMKPIPTLYKPLKTVDVITKEAGLASVERSDACAVPAAAIVVQNAVAWVILESVIEKFGGDHWDELRTNMDQYKSYLKQV